MIRRLITLASTMSLLICIAVAAVWIRSYRIADGMGFRPAWHLESDGGKLFVEWISLRPEGEGLESWQPGYYTAKLDADDNWRDWANPILDRSLCGCGVFIGVRSVRSYAKDPELRGLEDFESVHLVYVHYSLVEAAAAMLLFYSIRRRYVAKRRQLSGLFCSCSYDLSASADRCPECGRPVASAEGVRT